MRRGQKTGTILLQDFSLPSLGISTVGAWFLPECRQAQDCRRSTVSGCQVLECVLPVASGPISTGNAGTITTVGSDVECVVGSSPATIDPVVLARIHPGSRPVTNSFDISPFDKTTFTPDLLLEETSPSTRKKSSSGGVTRMTAPMKGRNKSGSEASPASWALMRALPSARSLLFST